MMVFIYRLNSVPIFSPSQKSGPNKNGAEGPIRGHPCILLVAKNGSPEQDPIHKSDTIDTSSGNIVE